MRNLYAELGLPQDGATEEQVRLATASCRDLALVQAANAVLLRPARRQAYDRQHRALIEIGSLRAYVGMNEAEGGRLPDYSGYRYRPPSPPPQKVSLTERIRQGFWICILVGVAWAVFQGREGSSRQGVARPASVRQAAAPAMQALPVPATGTRSNTTPGNGAMIIRTSNTGAHTMVRIYRGAQLAAEGFVRSGDQLRVPLGLGTYVLKTATGSAWYGWDRHFGSGTHYAEADDTFPIGAGDEWTITLIPQRDGNLSQKTIGANAF